MKLLKISGCTCFVAIRQIGDKWVFFAPRCCRRRGRRLRRRWWRRRRRWNWIRWRWRSVVVLVFLLLLLLFLLFFLFLLLFFWCGCFVVVLYPLTHKEKTCFQSLFTLCPLPFFLWLSFCLSFLYFLSFLPSLLPFSSFFPFSFLFLFISCCSLGVVLFLLFELQVFYLLLLLFLLSFFFWCHDSCCFALFGGGSLFVVFVVFLCCYVVNLAKKQKTHTHKHVWKQKNQPKKNNPPKRWKDFRAFWTWPVMLACAKVIVFWVSLVFFAFLVPNLYKNRFCWGFWKLDFQLFGLKNVGLFFTQ